MLPIQLCARGAATICVRWWELKLNDLLRMMTHYNNTILLNNIYTGSHPDQPFELPTPSVLVGCGRNRPA